MKRKFLEVADLTTLREGEMVALAAAFGNVDLQGDRIVRGAFAASVEQIKAGASLPLVWGHDVNGSPQNFIGEISDANETDAGLEIRASFDLEDPVGRKAYRLVKTGAVAKLSIGYRVRDQRRAKDGANELLEIELREASIVLNPANESTRVLAIKAGLPAPTDAELRMRAAALGIAPPMTNRELRRHTDDLALEVALGEPPRTFTRRANAAADADTAAAEQNALERRALRKRCDDLLLELAVGGPVEAPAPASDDALRRNAAELGHPAHAGQSDYELVKAHERELMLALLRRA